MLSLLIRGLLLLFILGIYTISILQTMDNYFSSEFNDYLRKINFSNDNINPDKIKQVTSSQTSGYHAPRIKCNLKDYVNNVFNLNITHYASY